MNILLLSNGAPNYHHTFKALVTLFESEGAQITVAVDSTFSRTENKLDELKSASIHTFDTYFKSHTTDRTILKRYEEFNLNAALLSDFERAQAYGIWGMKTSVDYFDRLKSALLSFFEMIFDMHQVDTVFYENVSNSFAHFALFVTQRKKKTYIGLTGSRLPDRFSLSSDPFQDDATERAFNLIRKGDLVPDPAVRRWARDYLSRIDTIVPDYMKINGQDQLVLLKRYLRRDRIPKLISLIRHLGDSRTDAFQIGNPLVTYLALFRRNLNRRFRSSRVRKFYQSQMAGERFLLYPLHFHPESSTSILAGTYLDEYEVIRNIAFNLPEGLRLYVKDHSSAWAYPTLKFYQRLNALPNVRILPPEAPTKNLIRDSEAVITLTSTVGYEALLLQKRVFLYGEVFYAFHEGVSRVANPAHLHGLLREQLAKPVDWDGSYNEDFVCAYFLSTLAGKLNLMTKAEDAPTNAKRIFTALQGSGNLIVEPVKS